MRTAALILPVITFVAIAAEAPSTPLVVDPKVLSCSPTTLKAGDSLKLVLGPGHGKELAIQGPRREQIYFLVVTEPPKDDPQLMSTSSFKEAKSVDIPTSIQARPWVADGKIEKVFSTPGTYRVTVSETLESEVGGFICRIRYIG